MKNNTIPDTGTLNQSRVQCTTILSSSIGSLDMNFQSEKKEKKYKQFDYNRNHLYYNEIVIHQPTHIHTYI